MPKALAAPIFRLPGAATTKRNESNLIQRIWHGADSIIDGTLREAQSLLEHDGKNATPEASTDLAYNLQLRRLDTAAQKGKTGASAIDKWNTATLTANSIALLMLSMPGAGRAQRELNAVDWNRGARDESKIATLSNFNNDLTDALVHMPRAMMADFPEVLLSRSQALLQSRWDIESMRPDDLYRSLRGVTREVAFWRALHNNMGPGWSIRQSNTREDVHGTDFVICDNRGRSMRVDVKARQRFDAVVDKLLQGRWISRHDADIAHERGFVYNPNTDETGARDGSYTCIFDADMFGDIINYEYSATDRAIDFVKDRFHDRQATATRQKFGRYALHQS